MSTIYPLAIPDFWHPARGDLEASNEKDLQAAFAQIKNDSPQETRAATDWAQIMLTITKLPFEKKYRIVYYDADELLFDPWGHSS